MFSQNTVFLSILGLDPKSAEHSKYLSTLSEEFVEKMCSMIHDAVQKKKRADGPLVEEIVQHVQFCQEKCRNFHGREDVLKVEFCSSKHRIIETSLNLSTIFFVRHFICQISKNQVL